MSTIQFPAVSLDTSEPFHWEQCYRDWPGTSRVIPAGYKGAIPLVKDQDFPPGYTMQPGEPGFPKTKTLGTEPIRIQPPIKGVGRLKFNTQGASFIIDLRGIPANGEMIEFRRLLGTTSTVAGAAKPLDPYLGVHDHELEDATTSLFLPPGIVMPIPFGAQQPFVDNAENPVATWPQWQMTLDPTTKLYPAICPLIWNLSKFPIAISDVLIIGRAS